MKFTGTLKCPQLDLAGYKAALHQHMVDLLCHLVLDWLETTMAPIPAWSGASRATFMELAAKAGVQINVGGSGEGVGNGVASSTGELKTDSPLYYFLYETDLFHLTWNEYHNANASPHFHLHNPGPYESQAKGMIAYLNFIKSIDLPGVAPFIQTKTIKL